MRVIAEVVPQAEGNGGQFQAAMAAATIFHLFVTVLTGKIRHKNLFD
jgi:hypothetical protein